MKKMFPYLFALMAAGFLASFADAGPIMERLRARRAAPAACATVSTVADAPKSDAKPKVEAAKALPHPIIGHFVRRHFVRDAIQKGADRASAEEYASSVLTDEYIAAALDAQGIKVPAAAPAGGWLNWILGILKDVLPLIQALVAIFLGIGF